MGFSAALRSETRVKLLNTSTTIPEAVPPGSKHTAVDVGLLPGSTIVARRTTSRLSEWQDKMTRTTQDTTKKGGREIIRTPQQYIFLTCLFAILFFIFVWPGHLDPLDPTNIAKYFRGDRLSYNNCTGRRVYMYELPPELNIAVKNDSRCNGSLMWWMDLCPRFGHKGYGMKVSNKSKTPSASDDDFDYTQWFDTDFYMLEMIFHTRLQNYRCLTKDSSEADAFFIPYYTGLIALDPLYEMENLTSTYEKRKLFGMELINWLESNGGEAWRKHGGRDHFMIMGRTTWDFRPTQYWGTGFSELPHVKNMTTLMLETKPTEPNEQSIPYPTAFHPDSPEMIQLFIERVKRAKQRKYLFTYVGGPRSDTWSMRGLISSSCQTAGASVCNFVDCSVVKCSHDPVFIHKTFLKSTFCLQPRGDSATRRSTFDCLISGSIPVFFHVDSAYTQYSWHLPADPKSYSVFIDENDVSNGVSIQEILMSYSKDQIEDMRRNIVAIIPNLLYNDFENDPWSTPRYGADAYELTIERVLERIAAAKDDERRQAL